MTRVNGETNSKKIAETFASYFESVYSGHETPVHMNLKTHFDNSYSSYITDHINDIITPYFLTWSDMIDLVSKVKPGKAASGSIKPEHLLHGSP